MTVGDTDNITDSINIITLEEKKKSHHSSINDSSLHNTCIYLKI